MSPIKQAATAALPKPKSTRVRKAVVPYSASPVVLKKPNVGKKAKTASAKKSKKTASPKKPAARKGKVTKVKKSKVSDN